MGLSSIAGAGRTPSPTDPFAAATPRTGAPPSGTASATELELDAVTRQPLPPRFPWLSRLAHRLEAASTQRPPFAPAPLIGERLDRKA